MASESESKAVFLSLPSELNDWLGEKATELGVDEETLVTQLLASYRTAEKLDDDAPPELLDDDVETAVRDVIADRIPDIARAVETHIDEGGEELAALEDRVDEAVERVDEAVNRLDEELDRLDREIDDAESSFESDLDDVRERVIQVKKEADAKAPADHSHPELDDIATLRAGVEDVQSRVDELDETVQERDGAIEEFEATLAELQSRLSDAEEKLDSVGWMISDLRDAHEEHHGQSEAIEQLKQKAAQKDIDRAVCDNCDNAVDIALLSEPKCPHCEATVSDVRLPGGFFGKPRLSVARQLEAGDGRGQSADVPDAARR